MKNYLRYILCLGILVSISACSGNSRALTEEEVEVSEELRNRFEQKSELVYHGDTLLAGKDVLSYYKFNEFQPIWIGKSKLNDKGQEMLDFVGDSRDYGFLPEMFRYDMMVRMADTSLLDAEMMLSNAFFLFTTHISVGCIDTITYEYKWKKDSIDFSLTEELDKVRDGASPVEVITAHQPNFWEYRQLQAGLAKFLDEYPLDTFHYDIPAFRDDSVKCYAAAHKALIGHAFLDSTVSEKDTVFMEQLRKFQRLNGLKDDGIVGKWTGRALNKSNLDRFYQACLSLEKWRWKQAFPERYIRVNIPEFTLYYVDSNEVQAKHRVVVGAYATQTPEFHAPMRRMVTNPYWHVPYSIASTEILYGAKKDSAYFAKRGYKVFQNGEQVDPGSVDWSSVTQNTFRYKVRQEGGGGNSLGRIKFLFPNSHFVYIHDTPSKRLFQNDVRAYSHGCVRLHRPFDLAKEILIDDQAKIQSDTLDSIVYRGIQRVVELQKPFEVYIEYFTATGDSSGKVIFHPDIYQRDERFLKNTFKSFEHERFEPSSTKEASEIAENS